MSKSKNPNTRLPFGDNAKKGKTEPSTQSYLVQETDKQERQRRHMVQEGNRQFGPVHIRNHEDTPIYSAEQTMQALPEHPNFENSQRYDGVDNNVSPLPAQGTPERTKMDNDIREEQSKQANEKQLKLGLTPMPAPGTAPKPRGP